MRKKRIRNHDQSIEILIPRTRKRVIEAAPMKAWYVPRVPDQVWMRERLQELERIHRPSASEGEREAAEWLVSQFAALGVDARIEVEEAHGTYWWPLGIGAAAGVLGGLAALRGRRGLGFALGALGTAAIADDFPPRQRRL